MRVIVKGIPRLLESESAIPGNCGALGPSEASVCAATGLLFSIRLPRSPVCGMGSEAAGEPIDGPPVGLNF